MKLFNDLAMEDLAILTAAMEDMQMATPGAGKPRTFNEHKVLGLRVALQQELAHRVAWHHTKYTLTLNIFELAQLAMYLLFALDTAEAWVGEDDEKNTAIQALSELREKVQSIMPPEAADVDPFGQNS